MVTAHPLPVRLSDCVLDLARRTVQRSEGRQPLTELEVAFLQTLLDADGQPVARETLLRDVWGYHANVRSRSIDHLVKRLRGKLERDRKHPEHLLTVHQVGYRLVAEVPQGPTSQFVGRVSEIAAVIARLDRPGITTILGPGGMGKSALAREAANRATAPWAGRVWWVDLDGVDTIERARSAIGDAVGMRVRGPVTSPGLGQWLAEQPPSLLVLDAAERVSRALTEGLSRWLERASQLRILVTSRVRLRVPGEQLLELGPLSEDDATSLIWDRARAARHDLPDTPETRRVLSQLAERLDRMPLALELAAARANLLSPEDLLSHVDQRLSLLAGPACTLASVLDASWALASADERHALVQLAVFRGGFRLNEAQAVLELPGSPLDVVQALRDQSWLRAWTPVGGTELRLGMYEGVRDYLRGKPKDGRSARLRHATVYAAYGHAEALRALASPNRANALARYGIEHANLRAAAETAIEFGRADLAVPAWRAVHKWLHYRGPFEASVALAERVLALNLDPGNAAVVLKGAADLHRRLGDAVTAERWARRAVAAADEAGDPVLGAQTREVVAALVATQGRHDEVEALLDEAERLLGQGEGEERVAASLRSRRAAVAQRRGQLEAARGPLPRGSRPCPAGRRRGPRGVVHQRAGGDCPRHRRHR